MTSLLLFSLIVQQAPVENSAGIARIIDRMRAVAPTYNMRDILFNSSLVGWERKDQSKKWRKQSEIYSARLAYHRKENWQLIRSAQDTSIKPSRWRVARGGCGPDAVSELADATFDWVAWADFRGHRSAVFKYSVPPKKVACVYRDGSEIVLASFSGTVFVDSVSGDIWRLVMTSVHPLGPSTETWNYDEVVIGQSRQVVPVGWVETTLFRDHEERDELTNSNIRRFQTVARLLLFSPVASSPNPSEHRRVSSATRSEQTANCSTGAAWPPTTTRSARRALRKRCETSNVTRKSGPAWRTLESPLRRTLAKPARVQGDQSARLAPALVRWRSGDVFVFAPLERGCAAGGSGRRLARRRSHPSRNGA